MRPKSKRVDLRPAMPRGATEFEEKRIACDFELVFKQIAEAGLSSIKETHELAYRAGFIAGKTRRELDRLSISHKLPSYIQIL